MATDNPRRERHLREAIEAEKAAFAERVQRLTKLGADPTSVTLDLLVTEMAMAKLERMALTRVLDQHLDVIGELRRQISGMGG